MKLFVSELSITEMVVLDMGVDTALQQGLLTFIEHQKDRIERATEAESEIPAIPFTRSAQQPHAGHAAFGIARRAVETGSLNMPDDVPRHSRRLAARSWRRSPEWKNCFRPSRFCAGAIQPRNEQVDLCALAEDVAHRCVGAGRAKKD